MLLPVTAALLNHSPEWKLPWNRLWVTTHNFGILWYSSLTFCCSSHIPRSRARCLPSAYWKRTSARPTQAGCWIPLHSMGCGSSVEGFTVFPEVSRKPWHEPVTERFSFGQWEFLHGMKESLLIWGSPAWQCGNRQIASIHTDSKGDGTEKGIFKDDKGLLFRQMVRNFITLRALNASVLRKGRNCILKCCLSHTSLTAV